VIKPFDGLGPLPGPGARLSLEASAGTGKTWSLTGLAVRYLVEAGYRIDQVMVITFSRASTQELRDRLRGRLEACADGLRQALRQSEPAAGDEAASASDLGTGGEPTAETEPPEASEPPDETGPTGGSGLPNGAGPTDGSGPPDETGAEVGAGPGTSADPGLGDPAWEALFRGRPEVLAQRLGRAEAGLRDFDRGAIFTTHGFCDSMLRQLGLLVDHDPSDRLTADLTELTRQATADLYLAWFGSGTAPFHLAEAQLWARQALFQPDLPLVRSDDNPVAADFTVAVRQRVDQSKRRLGLYTYDDMLSRLRHALADPATGQIACQRLADQYPVVLVDEFQDTDPAQWDILASAFLGRSSLIVIGDPKQSIYSFRGADVQTYLQATAHGDKASLDTNRRSSPPLVAAINALLAGQPLGDDRITVSPVRSSAATPRLLGAAATPWAAPLRLRLPADLRPLPVAAARQLIDRDLVADIADLLGRGLRLGGPGGDRPLTPGDIAVIVSTNRRGQTILERLTAAGLPATFSGAQAVFSSAAAADWSTLLRALAEPRTNRVRAAALSALIGWTLDELVAAGPDRLAELAASLRQGGLVMAQGGPTALLAYLTDQGGLAERLAARSDGGRRWTDLRQLAELLQEARRRERLDLAGLTAWLDRRRLETAAGDDTARRLETDAAAVRMLTVHQAKGLQFPVVYLPQAGDHYPLAVNPGQPFAFHDQSGQRWLDLGADGGRDWAERVRRHQEDEAAEQLRLLYVGLTRAACQVTTWWTPTKANLEASALHRLLGSRPGQAVPASLPLAGHGPADWPERAGIVVETMAERAEPAPAPSGRAVGRAPQWRRFDRSIDQTWRRTSYTALTADLDHAGPFADQTEDDDDAGGAMPPVGATVAPPTGAASARGAIPRDDGALPPASEGPRPAGGTTLGLDALSPMAELPGGTAFGSLVHAVFEHADPHDPAELAQVVERTVALSGLSEVSTEDLLAALRPGLHTSLGPIADGLALADLRLRDRLAELTFELPLAAAGRPARPEDLARLLERHLTADDPLADYPERLRAAGLAETDWRGFLTGSIDAVLRLGRPTRYLVVDYKTNRLVPPDQPLTLRHYTPPRLAEAMMASHYPLQALLYSVALHRFLRWRLPDYDPERHLGGMAYLFVRGMAGPDTPLVRDQPVGVFAWRPAGRLITDLDDLLAGRRP
jgi:exodeoxyribonuclease V beta subunit